MPKKITDELNELVRVVADNPGGLSPKAILDSLDPEPPERTLRSRWGLRIRFGLSIEC